MGPIGCTDDGEAQVAETTLTSARRPNRKPARTVRLVVRRARLVGPQADLFPNWRHIEMARSSSKMHAAAKHLGGEEATRRLRALLERQHPSGRLEIPCTSELFTGQR
ncbi:hypothetical protein [Candidatus Poriferisodalis sp.]|uniref:hypothetical protein n=1 Tax=Candidatus Poriferisodalis sp. TaxID=3101277 RepID=UPI003B029D22